MRQKHKDRKEPIPPEEELGKKEKFLVSNKN
jgi:hypothetical protein